MPNTLYDWESSSARFISSNAAYAAILVALALFLSYSRRSKPGVAAPKRSTTTTADLKKGREHGTWEPVKFDYPSITPHHSDPLKVPPIPYRPFRAGEYHVTMGIRSMIWDEWIEIDNEYIAYQRIRSHRIRTRGDKVIRVLPDNPGVVRSGGEASVELVHELAEYLSRRFPTLFEITRHNEQASSSYAGWYGLPPIKSVKVLPLGETHELPLDINDGENAGVQALEIASLMIQEDLAIMIEGTDGRYYFQAGSILVPGFWRIQDKIGMPLDEIHNSGNVPRYKEKLQMSMERFFQKMAVDKPVSRNNYFFQVVQPVSAVNDAENMDPEELAWAESSHGPEDNFSKTHPTNQPTRPKPTPSLVRLRTERQTLRRLPRSGAIVFTIRTYLTPVERFKDEPGVAKRLAGALRGWGDDIGEYKGKEGGAWWDVLMEYLDKCSEERAKEGEDGEIDHKYPF